MKVQNINDIIMFSEKFTMVDQLHQRQVAAIAVEFFDETKRLHKLRKKWRILLEAAALLHDIGISQGYEGHHKTSYKIIYETKFSWLSDREKIMIACMTRFHRKALPTSDFPEMMELSTKDQEKVQKLIALLRIADGFDRPHMQSVKKIKAYFQKDELVLAYHSIHPRLNEHEGAIKKGDYFCQLFKINLRIVKV